MQCQCMPITTDCAFHSFCCDILATAQRRRYQQKFLSAQDEVLEQCRGVWPERFKHGYAHFNGPMIEEFFFGCAHCLSFTHGGKQLCEGCARR